MALNKFSLWLFAHCCCNVTGNAILGLKAVEAETDDATEAVEAVKAGEAELGPEAE